MEKPGIEAMPGKSMKSLLMAGAGHARIADVVDHPCARRAHCNVAEPADRISLLSDDRQSTTVTTRPAAPSIVIFRKHAPGSLRMVIR